LKAEEELSSAFCRLDGNSHGPNSFFFYKFARKTTLNFPILGEYWCILFSVVGITQA
jgi:hypothetical protein